MYIYPVKNTLKLEIIRLWESVIVLSEDDAEFWRFQLTRVKVCINGKT